MGEVGFCSRSREVGGRRGRRVTCLAVWHEHAREYSYRKMRHHYVKANFFCWLSHNDLLSFFRGCYKLLQVPFVHSVCGIIYKRSEREHLLWLCELAEAPSRNAPPSQVLSIKMKKNVQQATICAKCTDSPTAVHSLFRPWSTFSALASLMDSGSELFLELPLKDILLSCWACTTTFKPQQPIHHHHLDTEWRRLFIEL